MFVTKGYYHGVPEALVPALEAIAQATVDEYFDLVQRVYDNPDVDVWNCSVYRSEVPAPHKRAAPFKRLVIVNHSCGYWAVFEWGNEYNHMEEYTDRADFWAYAAQDEDDTILKPVDWDNFDEDWGMGECDLFWKAIKNPRDEEEPSWYAPVHTLDFKHPLLMTLRQAF